MAIQRAAEIAVRFDESSHYRPDGGKYLKTFEEYGYDTSTDGPYVFGECFIFTENKSLSVDDAFQKLVSDNSKIVCGYFTAVAASHIKIDNADFWVLVFTDAPGSKTDPGVVKGEKYVPVNVPDSRILSLKPEYVSGAKSVDKGSTVAAPVYTVKALFNGSKLEQTGIKVSTAAAKSGDEYLVFNSNDGYIKAENGSITGIKAGKGTISASFLGKTVDVEMEVAESSSVPSRIQQLINGAAVHSNTTLSVSDDQILKSSDEVKKYIYDSINAGYTRNSIIVSSLDLLQPEEYYSDAHPGVSALTFSNANIYNNASMVTCDYTLTQTSFLAEERAVEYALYNGTDVYLTQSEKQLKSKVTELAASLKKSGEYDTVKSIHDYLVLNIAYTYQQNMGDGSQDSAQKLRSALFEGKCVCAGYAKAFYFLCKACGLDVLYISGTAINTSGQPEAHGWNKVKIGGKWYCVDCTWDDPYPDQPGEIKYNYFLVTDADISINHTTAVTGLPVADSTDLGIIYETYKNVEKFSSDSVALSYINQELAKVFNPSGFTFDLKVLSSDGSTLYDSIIALCNEYNTNYGCGYSYGKKSAGFYGYEFSVKIYR